MCGGGGARGGGQGGWVGGGIREKGREEAGQRACVTCKVERRRQKYGSQHVASRVGCPRGLKGRQDRLKASRVEKGNPEAKPGVLAAVPP